MTAERLGMSAAARTQSFPLAHMQDMLAREKVTGGVDALIPRFVARPTDPTMPKLDWNGTANGRIPISETDWQRERRLQGGYDELVEIDPAKAKSERETRNNDILPWNPGRLENLRGLLAQGTKIDDYPKVSMDDYRGFDVGDGRVGPEENLDQNGEEDDGYPVVLNKAVEKPQSIEERLRDNVRPPEVDSEVEVIPQFFKDAHIPRPEI